MQALRRVSSWRLTLRSSPHPTKRCGSSVPTCCYLGFRQSSAIQSPRQMFDCARLAVALRPLALATITQAWAWPLPSPSACATARQAHAQTGSRALNRGAEVPRAIYNHEPLVHPSYPHTRHRTRASNSLSIKVGEIECANAAASTLGFGAVGHHPSHALVGRKRAALALGDVHTRLLRHVRPHLDCPLGRWRRWYSRTWRRWLLSTRLSAAAAAR